MFGGQVFVEVFICSELVDVIVEASDDGHLKQVSTV